MSNYNSLKTTIDANIKQNGRQEITGQILNSVLNQMVNTLGTGYQFAGVATTATNPGTPDAKVFYIANEKGTYTNFGGISVTEDDVVVLYWDSLWHKVSTGIASQAKLTELEEKVDSLALGVFYGYFPNASSLPNDATKAGYAYVGEDNPYAIWNFNGGEWFNSGTSIDMNDADGITIERSEDGKLGIKDGSIKGEKLNNNIVLSELELASVNGNKVIRFKTIRGTSRKIIVLRNEDLGDTLTNSAFTDYSADYIIKGDFSIPTGEVVSVKDNCRLFFDGGSIVGGGTLNFLYNTLFGDVKIRCLISGNLLNDYINVQWFGADPYLGNDSTTAFDKAIRLACHSIPDIGFGKVYIPKGRYYISQALEVTQRIKIEGNGSVITTKSNMQYFLHVWTGIHIKNLVFDGGYNDGIPFHDTGNFGAFYPQNANTFSKTKVAIDSYSDFASGDISKGLFYCSLENVTFRNFKDVCIKARNAWHFNLDGCNFEESVAGIFIEAINNSNVIENCHFAGLLLYAITMKVTNKVTITRNTFEALGCCAINSVMGGCNLTITDNYFETASQYPIQMSDVNYTSYKDRLFAPIRIFSGTYSYYIGNIEDLVNRRKTFGLINAVPTANSTSICATIENNSVYNFNLLGLVNQNESSFVFAERADCISVVSNSFIYDSSDSSLNTPCFSSLSTFIPRIPSEGKGKIQNELVERNISYDQSNDSATLLNSVYNIDERVGL